MEQGNGASSFNPPTKLAHIVYRTRRFEQMLEWYKQFLMHGFSIKMRHLPLSLTRIGKRVMMDINPRVMRPDGLRNTCFKMWTTRIK